MSTDESPERMHDAYLCLGSNIEPEKNLPAAVRELGRFGRVRRLSGVWQSPPLDAPGQKDYLNAALLLETPLSAADLKAKAIASIELQLGRVRSADRYSPRTIDIDIILFDREILKMGKRRIPDPEVLERPFIAIPMMEIAPSYIHPETGETISEIASRFDPDSSGMRLRPDVVLIGETVGKVRNDP